VSTSTSRATGAQKTQANPETDAIRRYLADRLATSTKGLERGRLVKLLRRVSSHDLRQSAKVNSTRLFHPLSRRRVRALLRQGAPIRLNLGSGPRKLQGWVNVDVVGMNPDLPWDLRRGIPFPDTSVDAVFFEHVLEHFPLANVFEILDEAKRVLRPGGMVRVGVPDFGRYLLSYAGDKGFIQSNRPNRPTPLLAVAEVALFHGHRSVWDGETLVRTLEEAGFTEVTVRGFGESEIAPPPDTPMREPESLYAEGRKPQQKTSSG
jgi:predicted SAM-dependent methyltransferase